MDAGGDLDGNSAGGFVAVAMSDSVVREGVEPASIDSRFLVRWDWLRRLTLSANGLWKAICGPSVALFPSLFFAAPLDRLRSGEQDRLPIDAKSKTSPK
jgi:hypothetical protein